MTPLSNAPIDVIEVGDKFCPRGSIYMLPSGEEENGLTLLRNYISDGEGRLIRLYELEFIDGLARENYSVRYEALHITQLQNVCNHAGLPTKRNTQTSA